MDRDLENRIRTLPLRAPGSGLDQRIAVARQAAELDRNRRRLRRAAGFIGALAACIVVAALVQWWPQLDQQSPSAPLAGLGPLAATLPAASDSAQPEVDALLARLVRVSEASSQWIDGGMVEADGQPLRVLERQTMTRTTWIDPETGARIQTQSPYREIMLASQRVN